MLTEMKVGKIPLDHPGYDYSRPVTSQLSTYTDNYLISEKISDLSAGASYGSCGSTSGNRGRTLFRTYTLPEIRTNVGGGLLNRMTGSEPAGKMKYRSQSFVARDSKPSRSDPMRMTWDGGSMPRRSGRNAITLRMSNTSNPPPRVAFVRENGGAVSDFSKNKGKIHSSNGAKYVTKNLNSRRKGKLQNYRSNDNSEQSDIIGWCSTQVNSGFQSDNDSDDLNKTVADADDRQKNDNSDSLEDAKKRRVDFSRNRDDDSIMLVQKTRQISFADSSDDENEIQTPRTPKSILKKRDLELAEMNYKRSQGVSFNNKFDVYSTSAKTRGSARRTILTKRLYSPRPGIIFSCSREFAAAFENLDDNNDANDNDEVFDHIE